MPAVDVNEPQLVANARPFQLEKGGRNHINVQSPRIHDVPASAGPLYRELIYCDHMKSLLVQLDEPTYRALNRVAPAAKRQRAEFVRSAIRKAIRESEEERTRRAYLEKPDSESEADDWSSAEEWKP